MYTEHPAPMRMPCRTRPSSKKTALRNSRALTLCARCAASIRACPAAFTCIGATAKCWRLCILRCSVITDVMRDTQEFQEQVGRIDGLVRRLDSSPDPSLRGMARELVQSLMELHGAGLERILEIVSSTGGDAGAVLMKSLGQDELVSSLLVLYGLHPEDFETRVRRGLDKLRPFLRSRGAAVDLIAIEGDQVRLKIDG